MSNKLKHIIKIVVVLGNSASKKEIDRNELETSDWSRCILPEMLGVPLKFKCYRPPLANEELKEEAGIFLLVSPDSGLADTYWQVMGCGMLGFARTDGKDFTRVLFWQLHDYITMLMSIYSDTDGSRKARLKLNPRDFLDYTKETLEKSLRFRQVILL